MFEIQRRNVLWSVQSAKDHLVSLFNLEGTLPESGAPYGGVAQLGEHLPCKQGVSGSIPLISTMISSEIAGKRHIEN